MATSLPQPDTDERVGGFTRVCDHYQMVQGALLCLREEADRRHMTMEPFLRSVGLLTDRDKEIERELYSFTPNLDTVAECRRRLRMSPYYREILRRYRPEWLKLYLEAKPSRASRLETRKAA